MRRRVFIITAAILLAAVPAAFARGGERGSASVPKPYFDVRDAAAPAPGPSSSGGRATPRAQSGAPAPSRATLDARRDLADGLGEQAVVQADPVTGTLRSLQRLDGTLTGPGGGDRVQRAWDYVRDHAAAIGLDGGDLGTFVAEPARTSPSGFVVARWSQQVGGIPTFDSGLQVAVTKDGRVLSVGGAPIHGLDVTSTDPRLDPLGALAAVMDDIGVHRTASIVSGPVGAEQATRFDRGDRARLVLFSDVGGARLAWRVLYRAGPTAVYDEIVDAGTGAVLRRANLVRFAANEASVFRSWPGGPLPGPVSVDLTQYLDPAVSEDWFGPGIDDSLAGPNAVAWADLEDDNAPGPGEITRRAGSFVFPFDEFTPAENPNGHCDATHQCTWDQDVPGSWQVNQDNDITNVFWLVNRFHDHLKDDPQIAFGPSSGNFEGDDPVAVNGLDGALTGPDDFHLNNANMLTPPDGDSPLMQMYLAGDQTGYSQRNVSFDYDPATVWHEYTHGLSTRLVENGGVSSPQAGAMGEAWSDWYALDWMEELGMITDTGTPGEVDLGVYADPIKNETRTQPLDCPVGVNNAACPGRPPRTPAGGYTYASFGKISSRGAEVHADGEIWSETLWDLRVAIGQGAAQKVITDGMRLSITEPSFLDMRNAILAADQADFGGTHADDIWTVFAHRGMGFFAGAVDGGDVTPVANFDQPPPPGTPTGTVTGRVLDQDTGQPVAGAVVGFGGHDSAGYQTTTGADGRFTLTPVEGTYPSLFIRGPGYDTPAGLPATVQVDGGDTTDLGDRRLRRNYASRSGGAAIVATNDPWTGGCGPQDAIDGSQATGWSSPNPDGTQGPLPDPTPPGIPQGTPYQTIALPQTIDIATFSVDPAETCGDDPTAAVGRLVIETSTDGTTFTTAVDHTFTDADRHRMNDVTPAAGGTGVRAIRVSLRSPQDPSGDSGQDWIDLTELKVYGSPSTSGGGGGGGGGGGTTPTPTPIPPTPEPPVPPTPTPPSTNPQPIVVSAIGTVSVRRRGRVSVRIHCQDACSVRGRLLAGRSLRKLLHRTRSTLVDKTLIRNTAGAGTLTLKLSKGTRARLHRRHRSTVPVTLNVRVRENDGRMTTTTRRLRITV
ncbi:M36 family metallopeptidase [Capillimicrobium parvum]|uniref:FTP domain-containing protein n=1 Tax=Capillimicrobium parvum TaxID=2884022 RepID=A0A9E7C2V9_9ACTN|nr:M36 family metallopeptidase [Capillimicrobium parvum]UGS37873.1 hypothetical protein DSM104329_04294 [Capillimicrobium parvum]